MIFDNAMQSLICGQQECLLFAVSFFLGGAGAWLVGCTPLRLLLINLPDERSSHSIPVPRGGGLGILLAVIFAGLALKVPIYFLFPAILISVVSLYNDFLPLSVRVRLSIQLAAAIIILFPSFMAIVMQNSLMPVSFPIFIFFFHLIFIVGTTNFYNFMDGINGIAGISGIIAFSMLGLFGSRPLPFSGALPVFSFCVALACLGFLPFNMLRARVFMGDVGSILLGFLFAFLVVQFSQDFLDFICLAAFLFPFYADELTTMWERYRNGERLSKPHRRHLYQILVNEYGRPHWIIALIYGVGQILVALTVVWTRRAGVLPVTALLLFYFFLFLCISSSLRRRIAVGK